jgi:hypothetical protein
MFHGPQYLLAHSTGQPEHAASLSKRFCTGESQRHPRASHGPAHHQLTIEKSTKNANNYLNAGKGGSRTSPAD